MNKYTKWTDEMDARLISLWNDGATYMKITEELNVSIKPIYCRVHLMQEKGILAKRQCLIDPYKGVRTVWTTKMERALIRMKGEGLKNCEIAARLRCSIKAVESKACDLRREGRMPLNVTAMAGSTSRKTDMEVVQ